MRKQKGFTLLEMIISIGIFVLVATASSVLFNQAIRAYSYTTSRMTAAREAELAMSFILRDIRPDITTGDVSAISTGGFPFSDDDEITLVPTAGANIHYFRQAATNTIQREEVGVGSFLLAENVIRLSFRYFNKDNQDITATLSLDPTAAVTVEIIIETQVNNQNFRLYNLANR